MVDSGDTFGHPRSEGRRETATMNNAEDGVLGRRGC